MQDFVGLNIFVGGFEKGGKSAGMAGLRVQLRCYFLINSTPKRFNASLAF